MLQSFAWRDLGDRSAQFARISAEIDEIKGVFTSVWLPPPSESADTQVPHAAMLPVCCENKLGNHDRPFCIRLLQGYMPGRWTKLEGGRVQREAVRRLNDAGIIPVADTILNHRTASHKSNSGCIPGDGDWVDFDDPPMGQGAIPMDDYKCDSRELKYCYCDCGAIDTGINFCGAPDLDHTSAEVQELCIMYMGFLQDAGYRGFRLDMVKGYAGEYAGHYIR